MHHEMDAEEALRLVLTMEHAELTEDESKRALFSVLSLNKALGAVECEKCKQLTTQCAMNVSAYNVLFARISELTNRTEDEDIDEALARFEKELRAVADTMRDLLTGGKQ